MKKKHQPVMLIIILLFVVASVVGAGVFLMGRYSESKTVMDSNVYFGVENDTEAAVVLNGELTDVKALYMDGISYLPYTFASQEIYPGFYYDEDISLLCYTTQNEDISWKLDASGGAFITGPDNETYVSTELLKEYTGLNADLYECPNRIIITDEEYTAAEVINDSAIRFRAGIKSDILKNAAAGETLMYMEDIDDEWSAVATYDGFFGYIKSADIAVSEETAHTERNISSGSEFDHILLDGKVSMAWQYADNDENNALLDEFLTEMKGLNVICPTWISLADDQGNIISRANDSYMEKASAAGLDVWVMVDDVDGEGSASEVINSHDARIRLVSSIVGEVTAVGAQGINIDFEALAKGDIPAFIQFLKELTKAAHENGIIVSVDNFVPTYTGYYNRKTQSEIVDYIVIMGYDEHTYTSTEAGSVASLPFVRKGVEETLEEVDPSQVILGVPFYTRGWEYDNGTGQLSSSVLGMSRGFEFAEEHGCSLEWHETYAQYVGSSSHDGVNYSIWMEETESLSAKLDLADEYALAGASAWRLGYESSDVWDIWETYANR